jgi:quinol-cytochrome oxidoreductase complex cytochrome b subunit
MSREIDLVESNDPLAVPIRVALLNPQMRPAVRRDDERYVMTFPHLILREVILFQLVVIVLAIAAFAFDAPLEGIANPLETPNPAKAPWYFLGLQELLHYFPPVVAGVLIPTLVIVALVIIPYFNVNIEAEGVWLRNRRKRLQIFWVVLLALILLLVTFEVYAVLAPTLLIAAGMTLAARQTAGPRETQGWLASRPLSFWIMTWFLLTSSILTVIGTFFRGPGWSWVWPWRA